MYTLREMHADDKFRRSQNRSIELPPYATCGTKIAKGLTLFKYIHVKKASTRFSFDSFRIEAFHDSPCSKIQQRA